MTEAEIRELILLSEGTIDVQIQFWLTVTFATIVASFAARQLLSNKLRLIVSCLYLIATFVFVSRWYYEVWDLLYYVNLLDEMRVDNINPTGTALSRLLLVLFGTGATIYFVHYAAQEVESKR